jgi:hypothetical protein
MLAIAPATHAVKSSWWRRVAVRYTYFYRFAEEHVCNAPSADFKRAISKAVPSAGTYTCCECGQQWRHPSPAIGRQH